MTCFSNTITLILVLASVSCFRSCNADSDDNLLYPQFYDRSCPAAREIVYSVVAKNVAREVRVAASLIRVHFHDCFVNGCDASVLLDNGGGIRSEKASNPNKNSIRGLDVIDEIKSALEAKCPQTVSCADIVALAARDSTVLSGGPSWEVPLGRRDSRTASLSGSNNNIPAPNSSFQFILNRFNRQGLNLVDLVALSGNIPYNNICTSLYPMVLVDLNLVDLVALSNCIVQGVTQSEIPGVPASSRDSTTTPVTAAPTPHSTNHSLPIYIFLDVVTPKTFDNSYFKNLLASKGLLNSDQVLVTKNQQAKDLVQKYADNEAVFFQQFAQSMIKMGNISPLTGSKGEIRYNCRKINN